MTESSFGNHPALPIPPGRYHVDAALDDRLRAACSADPRGDTRLAHPAFAFVIALGGMGIDIGRICERLGLSIRTGAVLGRCHIGYDRPIELDRSYRVESAVEPVRRKPSRRFGRADHVTIGMKISANDLAFATVTVTMIVPAGAGA